MKRSGILLILICVLGASLIITGCNKKEEAPETIEETMQETETESETESQTEEIVEEQVIGEKTENAYDVLLTNNMGQNIVGIAIKEIGAEEYPDNMLEADVIFAVGDTARLYYSIPVEDEETTEIETESEAVLSDERLINELYTVQLTLEDETIVELTNFGFDDMDEAEICYEDEVGFLKYISKETQEEISTKEMELAQRILDESTKKETTTGTNSAQSTPTPAAEPTPTPASEPTPEPAPEPTVAAEEVPEVEQNIDGCLDDVLIN